MESDDIFSDIAHLLISEESPERVLEAIADALAQLVPHDMLQLYRADVALRVLRPVVVRDTYADEIRSMGPLPYGVGITGAAVESRVPQLANDAHLDPSAQLIPGTPDEPESLIAVPLLAKGEDKGALCLSRLGDGNHFSEEDFRLAIRFSELAALAIDNAQVRARLETEVITDHLTTLYNHRYFQERLREEIRRSNRQATPLALVMYDIDDFKRVNDCFGHQKGDDVLRMLAVTSRRVCRHEDVICRIGGEEFGVLLPGSTAAEATVVGDRLRAQIEALSWPEIGRITISVGVAEAPRHASTAGDLVAYADLMMLEAKAAGKNRVFVYGETPAAASSSLRGADPGQLRSLEQLRAVQGLCDEIGSLEDVEHIVESLFAGLGRALGCHVRSVQLIDDDTGLLREVSFRDDHGDTGMAAAKTDVVLEMGGRVVETSEPLYMRALYDSTTPTEAQARVAHSVVAVPLACGNRVFGAVVASKVGIDQFDELTVCLLRLLASHVALAEVTPPTLSPSA